MSVDIKDICVKDLIEWAEHTVKTNSNARRLSDIKELEVSTARAILSANTEMSCGCNGVLLNARICEYIGSDGKCLSADALNCLYVVEPINK